MKVLIADDDPVSLLYLQDALQEWGYDVVVASNGTDASEILMQVDGPVMGVIDWMMPGMEGTEVCRLIRNTVKDRYIYLIMLTLKSDPEFIVEAMDAGADDFVSKPFNAEELNARLRAGRRICNLEHQLRVSATHDALTGLLNRAGVLKILENEMARNARQNSLVSLIFADIDHFKLTNDNFGHLAGDAVLREVSRRISLAVRPYDSVGRYGGEEVIIVLPGCGADQAIVVAERVRTCIADPVITTDFGSIPTSISAGVASAQAGESESQLIHRADTALYRAKLAGRNRVEVET